MGHGAELVRVETPQQCLQPRWRRIADGDGAITGTSSDHAGS